MNDVAVVGEVHVGQEMVRAWDYNDSLVRSVQIGGETWWVAKDVCAILGIVDHLQAVERLDDDERGGYQIPTPGGNQTVKCISNSGLYALILRSDKPAAKVFRKWVTSVVLPQIIATGVYFPTEEIKARFAEIDELERKLEALIQNQPVAPGINRNDLFKPLTDYLARFTPVVIEKESTLLEWVKTLVLFYTRQDLYGNPKSTYGNHAHYKIRLAEYIQEYNMKILYKYRKNTTYLYFCYDGPLLEQVYRETKYKDSWKTALMVVPGAVFEKRMSFSHSHNPAIGIPVDQIPGLM